LQPVHQGTGGLLADPHKESTIAIDATLSHRRFSEICHRWTHGSYPPNGDQSSHMYGDDFLERIVEAASQFKRAESWPHWPTSRLPGRYAARKFVCVPFNVPARLFGSRPSGVEDDVTSH
jgi:hypothetical protein